MGASNFLILQMRKPSPERLSDLPRSQSKFAENAPEGMFH